MTGPHRIEQSIVSCLGSMILGLGGGEEEEVDRLTSMPEHRKSMWPPCNNASLIYATELNGTVHVLEEVVSGLTSA